MVLHLDQLHGSLYIGTTTNYKNLVELLVTVVLSVNNQVCLLGCLLKPTLTGCSFPARFFTVTAVQGVFNVLIEKTQGFLLTH